MKILASFFILLYLFAGNCSFAAEAYENYLKELLKKSKKLQSAALVKEEYDLKKEISIRPYDPVLEIERGRFASGSYDESDPWRVSVGWKLRMPKAGERLREISRKYLRYSKALYGLEKAEFIKNMNLLYTEWVYEELLYDLLSQERSLANKLAQIAKKRFINGAAKGVEASFLELAAKAVDSSMALQKIRKKEAYDRMIAFSAADVRPVLKPRFLYETKSKFSARKSVDPVVRILELKEAIYTEKAGYEDILIKDFETRIEYENESGQEIYRVTFSVKIPLFSYKREEAALERIEAKRSIFDKEARSKEVSMRLSYIVSSIDELKKALKLENRLLKEQRELLKRYEEGYEIAKSSLMEILSLKNDLVKTQRRILDIKKRFNDLVIEMNFLKGEYDG